MSDTNPIKKREAITVWYQYDFDHPVEQVEVELNQEMFDETIPDDVVNHPPLNPGGL